MGMGMGMGTQCRALIPSNTTRVPCNVAIAKLVRVCANDHAQMCREALKLRELLVSKRHFWEHESIYRRPLCI